MDKIKILKTNPKKEYIKLIYLNKNISHIPLTKENINGTKKISFLLVFTKKLRKNKENNIKNKLLKTIAQKDKFNSSK